mmetsp:Transcript_22836/g.34624  ORF Transcript_22836/g.34624 Transcript_22836/m.34624 type:complete len:371 (+) Transcript_22836:14-1126(+)
MSGYRSLHREQVYKNEVPIWQVKCFIDSKSSGENVLIASADGFVRIYQVREKQASEDLDASAMNMTCTEILIGINQVFLEPSETLLGCSQCQMIRNYLGDDIMSGEIVIVSLELTGKMRVWNFQENELREQRNENQRQIRSNIEFLVENATGTIMVACPPKLSGEGDLTAAVACLDGSLAIVSLGVVTPKAKKDPSPAGTILDNWGAGSIALSLAWHPFNHVLAVGRRDGIVDIIPATKMGQHRLTHHSEPVRAVSYTKDGALLVTGSDDGFLAVWDLQRRVPTMVHHVVQAHATWITGVATLADSRRFVTSGGDKKIHVWQLDQMYAPVHTFQSDGDVRSICTSNEQDQGLQRLYSGSDSGLIQVFSMD